MNNRIPYDREKTFQLLQKKDWKGLIELFKNNAIYSEMQNDVVAKEIINREFIDELISGSSFQGNADYLLYLEQFHILHIDTRNFLFKLSSEDLNRLIEKIILIYKGKDFQAALRYANRYPELAVSKEVISDYQRTQPKTIDHSQSERITVSENKEIEKLDATTSLFKSNLEYDFYLAVRLVYSAYMVLPNVALSAMIDFEKVSHLLNYSEKNYFFKGLVDCVVFDQANYFKPFILIEIDSPYHDLEEQKAKDLMKDNIIAKAGKKLYRIRKVGSRQLEQSEIIQLIRETVK